MKEGVVELAGQPCEDERGNEICGLAAAHHYASELREKYLDPLDKFSPITATLTIDKVPDGNSPLNIREEWVGVNLPLRRLGDGGGSQGMIVTIPDMLISLLSSGKLDAADHYARESINDGIPYWIFSEKEGYVTELESTVGSFEYFGLPTDYPEATQKLDGPSDDGSKL